MKPLNILVVDDELLICELVADMLHHKGYRVTTTTDSREGLRLFEKNAYDIVFTDYHMPYLNGVELAHRMKALKPTVPICLLSGTVEELQPEELALFTAIVGKPFISGNLTDAIDRALTSPSAFVHDTTRSPRYSVNWRLDYVPLELSLFAQAALEPRQTVIRNLAEGGISFVALEELTVTGLCAFVIYPPERENPFLAVGQVRWQREIDGQRVAGTRWMLWQSDEERDAAIEDARLENERNGSQ